MLRLWDHAATVQMPPVPVSLALPDGYREHLWDVFTRWEADALRAHARMSTRWAAQGYKPAPPSLDRSLFEPLLGYLETGTPRPKANLRGPLFGLFRHGWVGRFAAELARFDGLAPLHLFRVFAGLGLLGPPGGDDLGGGGGGPFRAYRRANGGVPDLDALSEIAEAEGWGGAAVGRSFLQQGRWSRGFAYTPEEACSYFERRPEELLEAMRGDFESYIRADAQRNAYAVMAAMGEHPPALSELAWSAALGTARLVRPHARAAISSQGDPTERLIEALRDRKQHVRANAAEWLGQLGGRAGIGPLEAAVAKEKSELAKANMFRALERLGVDLEPYLDREALQRTALKKLAKGVPAKLDWLDLQALPALRWRSDDAPVAPESVAWLLVNANKLKSVEPTPLLRLYGQRWHHTEALGDDLLDAWIAEDTRAQTRAELEPKIRAQAKNWLRVYSGATEAELFERLMSDALAFPMGSAQAHKGLLAVVAALGGPSVATKVRDYLKRYYGLRAPQCKTLLRMLAQRDDDASVAVLLATASRFRTKGIRKEAEEQVHQLAERRGWTPAELADRTVPTAGFVNDAERGRPVLALEMGSRTLHAVMDDEMRVLLDKGDGKLAKTFPKPRQGDDPELAASAKKAFSAAKKSVKEVVRLQGLRLYEAMCTGQVWEPEMWQTHLADHVIVGRLCERIVWAAVRDDTLVASFRPLEDGTLSDLDDEPVTLEPGMHVKVAHDSILDEHDAARWAEHFSDYEVLPLFSQFSARPLELSPEQREELSFRPFEGHLVQAFVLRSKLQARGYARGPAGDGGWFYTYVRSFPTLRLEAAVGFSGSPPSVENVPVALMDVRFSPTGVDGRGEGVVLGDVPEVLLREVVNDVAVVAALGTGFDPAWETKVG